MPADPNRHPAQNFGSGNILGLKRTNILNVLRNVTLQRDALSTQILVSQMVSNIVRISQVIAGVLIGVKSLSKL